VRPSVFSSLSYSGLGDAYDTFVLEILRAADGFVVSQEKDRQVATIGGDKRGERILWQI